MLWLVSVALFLVGAWVAQQRLLAEDDDEVEEQSREPPEAARAKEAGAGKEDPILPREDGSGSHAR
jgi:hypothetical protein